MKLRDKFKTYEKIAEDKAAAEKAEQRRKQKEAAQKKLTELLTDQFLIGEDLTEDQKKEFTALYKEWEPGKNYKPGDHVEYNGAVYSTIQGHTSQADWTPPEVPALFKTIYQTSATDPDTGDEQEVIPDFVQPTATTYYTKGDKVLYNGVVYESLLDVNTYSPDQYPAGWKALT